MNLVTHTHVSVRQHRVLIKVPIMNSLNIKISILTYGLNNFTAFQFSSILYYAQKYKTDRFFLEIDSITEEFSDKSCIKII